MDKSFVNLFLYQAAGVFSIITAMNMPESIRTVRLLMRKPHPEDVRAIFNGWAQDLEVLRYLTWRPHKSVEDTERFIKNCLSAWNAQTRFPYMITLNYSFR
jgi:[ribosomal protein S5]-alanine N-acetyltransferase